MRIAMSDAYEPKSLDIDGDGKSSPIEYLCYVVIAGIIGLFFYGNL